MLLVTYRMREELKVSAKSVSVTRGPGKTYSVFLGVSPEFAWPGHCRSSFWRGLDTETATVESSVVKLLHRQWAQVRG